MALARWSAQARSPRERRHAGPRGLLRAAVSWAQPGGLFLACARAGRAQKAGGSQC